MTREPVTVRAREPEDMPQVAEVLNQPQAVWGTLQLPFTSLDARRSRESAAEDLHVVGVIGGRVVGCASLHPAKNRRRAHVASIGMAVHDAHASRGVGTALLSALVEQADRWLNLSRLELNVYADNTRAIALYERFGFEREGLHRAHAFRDGAWADSISMARLRFSDSPNPRASLDLSPKRRS